MCSHLHLTDATYRCFQLTDVFVVSTRVQLYRPHGVQATTLLCPRDFTGKNTGVGCHALSSRESSQPRDRTQVSRIAGWFFTVWTTREAHRCVYQDVLCWTALTHGYGTDHRLSLYSYCAPLEFELNPQNSPKPLSLYPVSPWHLSPRPPGVRMLRAITYCGLDRRASIHSGLGFLTDRLSIEALGVVISGGWFRFRLLTWLLRDVVDLFGELVGFFSSLSPLFWLRVAF